jgi:hypothetical protein
MPCQNMAQDQSVSIKRMKSEAVKRMKAEEAARKKALEEKYGIGTYDGRTTVLERIKRKMSTGEFGLVKKDPVEHVLVFNCGLRVPMHDIAQHGHPAGHVHLHRGGGGGGH